MLGCPVVGQAKDGVRHGRGPDCVGTFEVRRRQHARLLDREIGRVLLADKLFPVLVESLEVLLQSDQIIDGRLLRVRESRAFLVEQFGVEREDYRRSFFRRSDSRDLFGRRVQHAEISLLRLNEFDQLLDLLTVQILLLLLRSTEAFGVGRGKFRPGGRADLGGLLSRGFLALPSPG